MMHQSGQMGRYKHPQGHYMASWPPTVPQLKKWIDREKPNTVLFFEGLRDHRVWTCLKERGIKLVGVVHHEWFGTDEPWALADVLVAPTSPAHVKIRARGLQSVRLNWPLDLSQFPYRLVRKPELMLYNHGHGGYRDRKSEEELIEIYRRLSPRPPLLVRTQIPFMEDASKELGIKCEMGKVNEPHELYTQGDLAIQISKWEGYGLTMLESMACGMPCVVTDGPPMNDHVIWPELLVKSTQRTIEIKKAPAIAHDPDVDDAVAKISALMEMDLGDLSRACREHVEKEYSWEVLKDKWVQLLV